VPSLAWEDDGTQLRVENRGSATSEPAYLSWRQQVLEVPSLAAGSTWSPSSADLVANPELRSTITRVLADRDAIAMPESVLPMRDVFPASYQAGWTVIEARAE
jgi:hypothetical protein